MGCTLLVEFELAAFGEQEFVEELSLVLGPEPDLAFLKLFLNLLIASAC